MKVLLFRHGVVRHENEKVFLGRTDPPLNAEGRHQAEAWRNRFRERSRGLIISSPLKRALEFAGILSGERESEITVCPEFAEIDLGDWDGHPMSEIQKADSASWKARGKDIARFRPPHGESFEDVQKRALPVFEKLISHADSELIIVAHAGVNRVILCHLLGMPLAHLFRIGQDYACLNVLEAGPYLLRASSINVPCPL